MKLEADFQAPYDSWKQNPGSNTLSPLMKAVDPILDMGVRTYSVGTPGPNLKSKAKKIAIKSFQTYDPTAGTMRSHLMSQLQGLRRSSMKQQQMISIPEQVLLDKRTVEESEAGMRDWLGRQPSDAELADETGMSLKRLSYVRGAYQPVSTGYMSEVGEAGAGGLDPAVQGGDPLQYAEFIYHDLGPIDQSIMEYSLGLNGSPVLSTTDIAKRLGISPGAISQRSAKIQAMLDRRDELDLGI